jgi:hypothetical protein
LCYAVPCTAMLRSVALGGAVQCRTVQCGAVLR